jgi:hypothetical protein
LVVDSRLRTRNRDRHSMVSENFRFIRRFSDRLYLLVRQCRPSARARSAGAPPAWQPWLADEPVSGEPVSPCYSLFSPVMFGKTGKFPFLWNDIRSTFFQVLSSFPFVMVFSLRCKNCDHFSTEQGYFFNVSGMLDWVTGENSKRLRKQQLRSSPLLSLTLFGHGPRDAERLPCPRTYKGSAGPSGRSAGRQASKTKDFLTRLPPAVTLFRLLA